MPGRALVPGKKPGPFPGCWRKNCLRLPWLPRPKRLSIILSCLNSFSMAFLNFLPNKSAEFFSNKFLSSSKSKDSGETFASRLLRRSESPQKEAFPTSEIAWRTNSTTTAGSKPVWCSFAARAASHNCVRGPIGSKIRAARFNCLLSMLGLNEMPLRLKYFFINLSTFFGRKSA